MTKIETASHQRDFNGRLGVVIYSKVIRQVGGSVQGGGQVSGAWPEKQETAWAYRRPSSDAWK
jgi:hypothetical protein